jgi:hypothetical protein
LVTPSEYLPSDLRCSAIASTRSIGVVAFSVQSVAGVVRKPVPAGELASAVEATVSLLSSSLGCTAVNE